MLEVWDQMFSSCYCGLSAVIAASHPNRLTFSPKVLSHQGSNVHVAHGSLQEWSEDMKGREVKDRQLMLSKKTHWFCVKMGEAFIFTKEAKRKTILKTHILLSGQRRAPMLIIIKAQNDIAVDP